jgi:hypothetical protein
MEAKYTSQRDPETGAVSGVAMVASLLKTTQVLADSTVLWILKKKGEYSALATAIPELDLSRDSYTSTNLKAIQENCAAIVKLANELDLKCPFNPLDLYVLISLSNSKVSSIRSVDRTVRYLQALANIQLKTGSQIFGATLFEALRVSSPSDGNDARMTVVVGPAESVDDMLEEEMNAKFNAIADTVASEGKDLVNEIVQLPVRSELATESITAILKTPMMFEGLKRGDSSSLNQLVPNSTLTKLQLQVVKCCQYLPAILAMHDPEATIPEDVKSHLVDAVVIPTVVAMNEVETVVSAALESKIEFKISGEEMDALAAFRGLFRALTVRNIDYTLYVLERRSKYTEVFTNACIQLMLQVPHIVSKLLRVTWFCLPLAGAFFKPNHKMDILDAGFFNTALNRLLEKADQVRSDSHVTQIITRIITTFKDEIPSDELFRSCPLRGALKIMATESGVGNVCFEEHVFSAVRIMLAGILADILWFLFHTTNIADPSGRSEIEKANIVACKEFVNIFHERDIPVVALNACLASSVAPISEDRFLKLKAQSESPQ